MNKRARLSIDLDAWPEIRDLLLEAVEATQISPTKLTILALEKQLPAVMLDIRNAASQFLEQHPGANPLECEKPVVSGQKKPRVRSGLKQRPTGEQSLRRPESG